MLSVRGDLEEPASFDTAIAFKVGNEAEVILHFIAADGAEHVAHVGVWEDSHIVVRYKSGAVLRCLPDPLSD